MFLVAIKLQKTRCVFPFIVPILLLVTHSSFLFAQSLMMAQSLAAHPPEKLAVNTANVAQQEPINITPEDDKAIVWPMLPNESVASLAQLFYPKSKKMQQLFIARTLQLSREIQPTLKPASVSNVPSFIMIPNIKLLAKQAGTINPPKSVNSLPHNTSTKKKLHLSYSLKGAINYVINPKMQADYEELIKRNEFLKQELEKLNVKLAYLQDLLVVLKAQTIALLSRPEKTEQGVQNTQNNAHLVSKPKSESVKQSSPAPNAIRSQSNPLIVKPALKNLAPTNPISANSPAPFVLSKYFTLPISAMVLLIAVIIGFVSYARKQTKKLYLASTGNFDPLKSGAFTNLEDLVNKQGNGFGKLDFSLTQSEYSGVMSVTDLTDADLAPFQQESDLVLEQARIYVHIGRVNEATELLRAQIKAMPKASLHHWLYLLDIYREDNQKVEFLQYAKTLHETFNVMMPLWDNTPLPVVIAESVEEFPHIMSKLTALWADPTNDTETKAYLEELMNDNRDRERTGFSMEAFQEIVMLRDVLTLRQKLAGF